jgi:S-adenosylmethionine synthetase
MNIEKGRMGREKKIKTGNEIAMAMIKLEEIVRYLDRDIKQLDHNEKYRYMEQLDYLNRDLKENYTILKSEKISVATDNYFKIQMDRLLSETDLLVLRNGLESKIEDIIENELKSKEPYVPEKNIGMITDNKKTEDIDENVVKYHIKQSYNTTKAEVEKQNSIRTDQTIIVCNLLDMTFHKIGAISVALDNLNAKYMADWKKAGEQ